MAYNLFNLYNKNKLSFNDMLLNKLLNPELLFEKKQEPKTFKEKIIFLGEELKK